jgi:hypothetical protein
VKSDPALWESGSHLCLCGAQNSVLKIHQHLVDISRLAWQTNNDLPQHYSEYKQAYLSEHRKLIETVSDQKVLIDTNERLEQENHYIKHQLIPRYESTFQRQEVSRLEAQVLVQSLEAKLQMLEKLSRDEQPKQTGAYKATVNLVHSQTQETAVLKKRRKTWSNSPQIPTTQPRRSSRLGGYASPKIYLSRAQKGVN